MSGTPVVGVDAAPRCVPAVLEDRGGTRESARRESRDPGVRTAGGGGWLRGAVEAEVTSSAGVCPRPEAQRESGQR